MILNKRIELTGDKRSRIKQAMENAGWYEGRRVTIPEVQKYYLDSGIELFPKALDFFSEFFGLVGDWYIKFENFNNAPDFSFYLIPNKRSSYREDTDWLIYDDINCTEYSYEYLSIAKTANQNFIFIGHIGYYYPARVWLSEDGCFFTTHEYDDIIHVFTSVFELIEDELKFHDMNSVAMKQ